MAKTDWDFHRKRFYELQEEYGLSLREYCDSANLSYNSRTRANIPAKKKRDGKSDKGKMSHDKKKDKNEIDAKKKKAKPRKSKDQLSLPKELDEVDKLMVQYIRENPACSNVFLAEQLNIHRDSVSKRRNNPVIKRILHKLIEQDTKPVIKIMVEARNNAARTIINLCSSPNPFVQLQAARYVLDFVKDIQTDTALEQTKEADEQELRDAAIAELSGDFNVE